MIVTDYDLAFCKHALYCILSLVVPSIFSGFRC